MTIDELKTLRDKAQAEYEKKIEAIDLVMKMLDPEVATISPSVKADAGRVVRVPAAMLSRPGKSRIRLIIESAVEELGDETFTTKDLHDALITSGRSIARSTIKKNIREMAMEGFLEIVQMHVGSNPGMYRKTQEAP